ncbi:J domain-containing protein [Fervidobacterium sp.]
MARSIYELLNVEPDTPHIQIEALYREYLEKYEPKRYENSPLKPIAMAKYNELIEAYEVYKREQNNEIITVEYSKFGGYADSTLKGYRPGYYYRRSNGCCDDVCQCIGCLWVGDTCCECMGGDCISCM